MFELDHIVHFVDKPEEMPAKTKEIGIHTVLGGKHEMWGTYNSLSYFGLSYVEFIGVFDEELIEQSSKIPFTLHDTYVKNGRKIGFTRLAFRTNSIEKDAEKFRQLGFIVDGPKPFSRVRPDGTVAKWKLLHFGKPNSTFDFPFFIQWEESDEERMEQLIENGTIKEHDAGPLAIDEIVMKINDIQIAKDWATSLDLEVVRETNHLVILKGANCNYRFEIDESKKNGIFKVVLKNAKNEKELLLEEGLYHFIP